MQGDSTMTTVKRRNKTNFENFDRRKRADRRGKSHWPELEAEINKWILKERDDGKAVSTSGALFLSTPINKSASEMKEITLDVGLPKQNNQRVIFQCGDRARLTSDPVV
ncbi:hypothetical protein TNCV_1782601 [Trichonephila clavipes]|nr:hypothetical protein TNCV_1782601 [Trichonephila clavipes]